MMTSLSSSRTDHLTENEEYSFINLLTEEVTVLDCDEVIKHVMSNKSFFIVINF